MTIKRIPKIRKLFELSPGEIIALDKLTDSSYSFPADTEVGVMRKMLREAWAKQFPGVEFPSDQKGYFHE